MEKFRAQMGLVNIFRPGDAFASFLEMQETQLGDLVRAQGFGAVATILRFADYPLAPRLIGFILGTMLEHNFARARHLYQGFDFTVEPPMTLGRPVPAAVLAVLPGYRGSRARQRAEGVGDAD